MLAVYQLIESFMETNMSWARNSLLHFEHLNWSGSADLWGAFPSLRISGSLTVQIRTVWWMWKNFPAPGGQEIVMAAL
jgi:hypothetical protein